jgi:hypothetical protein
MLDALIRWSLEHRLVVLATAVAFLLYGGLVPLMPVDASRPHGADGDSGDGIATGPRRSSLPVPIETAVGKAWYERAVRVRLRPLPVTVEPASGTTQWRWRREA